jgi:hypothetical protein
VTGRDNSEVATQNQAVSLSTSSTPLIVPAAPPATELPALKAAAKINEDPKTVLAPRFEPAPLAQSVYPPPVEQAPTIQVTIGRVEVRAASAAMPTPKRQAPPALSLSDYLQHRQRGGR